MGLLSIQQEAATVSRCGEMLWTWVNILTRKIFFYLDTHFRARVRFNKHNFQKKVFICPLNCLLHPPMVMDT